MTADEGCKLPCPLCGSQQSRTLKTRWVEPKGVTWRRRVCLDCEARFSTHEHYAPGEPAIRLNPGRLSASS